MEERTIEQGGVTITLSQATVLLGMRRTRVQLEGREADEPDTDRRLLRMYTYPDLVGAVVEVDGLPWPLDFETFLGLPDSLVVLWERETYALNPHWLPSAEPAEKKARQTPSTGN